MYVDEGGGREGRREGWWFCTYIARVRQHEEEEEEGRKEAEEEVEGV